MNHGRCLIGLTRMARFNMTCYSQPSAARLSTSARFHRLPALAATFCQINSQTRRPSASPLNALSLLLLLPPPE